MYRLWLKLVDITLAMLCCGRKKENLGDTARTEPPGGGEGTGGGGVRGGDLLLAGGGIQAPLQGPPYTGGPAAQGVRPGAGAALQGPYTDRSIQRSQRLSGQPNGFDMGIKSIELFEDYTMIETLEIKKRPGQTLGFYIREGNGVDRTDGVFISRVAPGGVVDKNGLLRVGEEIIAVDSVDVTRMILEDVVMLISIPRRIVLTVRTKKTCCKNLSMPALSTPAAPTPAAFPYEPARPVYVRKGRGGGVTSSVGDVMTDVFADDVMAAADATIRRRRAADAAAGIGGGGPMAVRAEVHRGGGQPPRPSATAALFDWYAAGGGERVLPDEDVVYRELPRRRRYEHRSWDRAVTSSPRPGERTRAAGGQQPDYSSDTDGRHLRELMPAEWRRLPAGHPARADYDAAVKRKEMGGGPVYAVASKMGAAESQRGFGVPFADRRTHVSESEGEGGEGGRGAGGDVGTSSLPRMDFRGGSAKDELKHWLRKLDKLSFELQDFNHKEAGAGMHDGVEEPLSPGRRPIDFSARATAAAAAAAAESYTADEYRSWIQSRRSTPTARRKNGAASPRLHRRGHSVSEAPRSAETSAVRQVQPPTAAETLQDFSEEDKSAATKASVGARSILKTTKTPAAGAERRVAPPRVGESIDQPHVTTNSEGLSTMTSSLAKKPLRIKAEEFRVTASRTDQPAFVSEQRGLDGVLSALVYCGHGLKAARTTMRELYCVLSVDSVNRARTGLRSGAINFDWDEDFEVDLLHARRASFSVYSWEAGARQKLCFGCSVDLCEVMEHGPARQSLALRLDPTGILYVELAYIDLHARFARRPAREGAVFGVPLVGLVEREGVNDGVPIVVRRCVEDVEMRGVEGVGLYRLCGSARRVGQLREELEADPRTTRLSPTGIPDISVVTGVLKSFFQDLPEPLLTHDLYPMLLDAYSVQIEEDPRGNADLMFGIIDCLPLANLATLNLLMTHLKRVIARNSVNRMTCAALGQIFGPLLMCPSSTAPPRSRGRALKKAIDVDGQVEVVTYILEIWPNAEDP